MIPQSTVNLSDLSFSATTESFLSAGVYSNIQSSPYFVLGIAKKTTNSDFVYDEVFQDVAFADNIINCIEPYKVFCSTRLTDRIGIDDFPVDLKRMISSLERQEILQALEISCLNANSKRWHLVSECSKISYHYRCIFWTQIVLQTLQGFYKQWSEKMEDIFGELISTSLFIITYLPFQAFLFLSVFFTGFMGLMVDVFIGRYYLRHLSCIQNQLYDAMMLFPEYSTTSIEECIKGDLEKIAINMERMYSNQIEISISTERYALPPNRRCSLFKQRVGQQTEAGLTVAESRVQVPSNKNFDDYDLETKKRLGVHYEERFLLYFYPANSTRLLPIGQMDTIYFNSNFSSSASLANLAEV